MVGSYDKLGTIKKHAMLTALSIRNLVIIEALDLSFGAGLNTLTGETGAGKSILLDALGLALGARAEAGLVSSESKQASVTAQFELSDTHPVWAYLAEAGAGSDEQDILLLRRVLNSDGRSRAFINDIPVSISLLRQTGNMISEIHGQFEQYELLDPNQHREFLDISGNLEENLKSLSSLWSSWHEAERKFTEASKHVASMQQDEAFLRDSIEELMELSPEEDEETQLASRRAFLANRARILEALTDAMQSLENSGAATAIRQSERSLARLADAAEGNFDNAISALERAGIELAEAEQALSASMASLDADTDTLEFVETRLIALRRIARKHHTHPNELPSLLIKLRNDFELLEHKEDQLSGLRDEVTLARSKYVSVAEDVSKKRLVAARKLEQAVHKELPPLKLERAEIKIETNQLEEINWGPNGIDKVRFMARANPGHPFGEMHKVASGGELARFALALKVVLSNRSFASALIFDEVDAGIGGATADAVGKRLKRLSSRIQTLVITHSPQVAALGEHHYQVQKKLENGRTRTTVTKLKDEARREEIARMLSGSLITEEARAQAERLINSA